MPIFGFSVPWWITWIVVPAISLINPALGAILSAIIKIINGLPAPERKAAIQDLTEAAKVFKKTGDSKPLADLTHSLHKKYCDGVACPTGLVSE